MTGLNMRKIARGCLPPVLYDSMRRIWQIARFGAPEWEYLRDGWSTVDEKIKGWSDPSIAETQRARWPAFLRATEGTAPLGVSPEAAIPENNDYYAHHVVMAYGYVLSLSASGKSRISLLDWGGGIGHYYIFARRLCPDVVIEYSSKDLTLLCAAGREVLPEATFVESDADIEGNDYDLVVASGSLQCSPDWRRVIRLLASVANPYLYVTRLPIIQREPSFVAVQRVYAYGYNTEYMAWFLNWNELVDAARAEGMELLREFAFHEHPRVKNAPEQGQIRGFLFRRKNAGGS